MPGKKIIYLDNAATTRPDDKVTELAAGLERSCYGNDASVHALGVAAALRTERARAQVAAALNASPEEMIFTSGGTEANNLALAGAVSGPGKRHIVISALEHPSVFEAARRLELAGAGVTVVRPDRRGVTAPAAVSRALRPETALVSVMHASNETGAVQPVGEIAAVCRRAGALFHTDAVQSFTRLPLDVKALRPDMVTVSAHKLHGPKGAGALYVRKGLRLRPLLAGGGQEGGLRPGTRNIPAIAGFGLAVTLASPGHVRLVEKLRDLFWRELSAELPSARLNSALAPRLCGILSVTLPGIASAAGMVRALGARGLCLSAGSACSSGKSEPSRALLAMGLSPAEALRTVRVSFGRFNTAAEVSRAAKEIAAYAA